MDDRVDAFLNTVKDQVGLTLLQMDVIDSISSVNCSAPTVT